jgi:hypothetical protein
MLQNNHLKAETYFAPSIKLPGKYTSDLIYIQEIGDNE